MTSKENAPNYSEPTVYTLETLPDDLKAMAFGALNQGIPRQLQERLQVLHKAHHAFCLVPMMQGKSSNFDSERLYYNLYQDILENEDIWFNEIFCDQTRMDHVERATGILGTLATIRRQRGAVESCLEIMTTYKRVLTAYQNLTTFHGTAGDKACCRILTYKYNLIGINANIQTGQKYTAVKHFRDAVAFEIEEGYNEEQQTFAIILKAFVGDNYMSKKKLKRVTDDQIWSVLSVDAPQLNVPKIKLLVCDGCGVQEEMHGDFLCCSACENSKACYCSKDCQRAHWKQIHKRECGASGNPCGVDFDEIKDVAVQQTLNHAETVKNHTKKSVTEEQRKAAFPGLVKLIKEFLKQRPDLDLDSCFYRIDDPEFQSLLEKYFSEQPGFEIWGLIHEHPNDWLSIIDAEAAPPSSTELFHEKTVFDWVLMFMKRMIKRYPDLILAQTQRIFDTMLAAVKQYVLDHPEHNSFVGFSQLEASDDFFKFSAFTFAQFLV